MIWLNAPVLAALAALAAPILIHILVQRRAERFPFPTLRFLQPTRLAAIRRHVLEDAGLLAVRAAILAVAVAALAGPLIVTPVRRQAWERRVVRAIAGEGPSVVQTGDQVFRSQQFTGASLRDAIRRASAWLEQAPPARRELVVVSPLAIGSLDASDIAAIPASIGIRFERQGALPQTRTAPAGRLIGADPVLLEREITFAAAQTAVRDVPTSKAATWPIDVVHAPGEKAAVDAAKAAVLKERVRAAPPDRRVRLVIGAESATDAAVTAAAAITQPWMADAAARIVRDSELQAAAARLPAGLLEARFSSAPWQTLASAANGRPLVVVADRLVVSAASASDLATPLLMRAIANGIAPELNLQQAEVVPIPGGLLEQWSRPAPAPDAPNADALRQRRVDDDRRWFWLAALCLIAFETWLRRTRRAAADEPSQHKDEARVA